MLGNNRILVIAALVLAAATGCGGGSGGTRGGGGTNNVFSCDQNLGGVHSCNDYSWAGGVYSTMAWQQACTGAMGKAGTGCDTTGGLYRVHRSRSA